MDQLTQFLTDPVNYIRNFSFDNLRQILVPIFIASGAYLWTTGTTINGRYVPWLSYMLVRHVLIYTKYVNPFVVLGWTRHLCNGNYTEKSKRQQ
jgi:hypothetical protein